MSAVRTRNVRLHVCLKSSSLTLAVLGTLLLSTLLVFLAEPVFTQGSDTALLIGLDTSAAVSPSVNVEAGRHACAWMRLTDAGARPRVLTSKYLTKCR